MEITWEEYQKALAVVTEWDKNRNHIHCVRNLDSYGDDISDLNALIWNKRYKLAKLLHEHSDSHHEVVRMKADILDYRREQHEDRLTAELKKRFKPKQRFISLFGAEDFVNDEFTFRFDNGAILLLGQSQFRLVYDHGWRDTSMDNYLH